MDGERHMNARKEKRPLLFVLSVDTEEEWDWSGPIPQKDYSVNNIFMVPEFQRFCNELDIKPTYFVDYAVIDNPSSASIIQETFAENDCEVGAHLHPWCNPPFYGLVDDRCSHVINLPVEQTREKLDFLVRRITDVTGASPLSFRSGRWGLTPEIIDLLIEQGITIDSSVYPLWKTQYIDFTHAPRLPYWVNPDDPMGEETSGLLYEIPVTVGYNRKNFSRCEHIRQGLEGTCLRWMRLVAMAWHTGLLRKIYLCPELSTARDMKRLCDIAIDLDYPLLHMYLHSSSFIKNNNSPLGARNTFENICQTIRDVIEFIKQRAEIEFCTISTAGRILQRMDSGGKPTD